MSVNKKETNLLPSEKKTIADTYSFARKYANEIKNLKSEFGDKGGFGLFWDSKQPENNRSFPWMSFKSSNKSHVMGNMEKYQDFYEEVVDFVNKLEKDDDDEDLQEKVLDLYEKLSNMDRDADWTVKNTTSSALYNMCKKFLSTEVVLENKLRRVENVILKKEMRKMAKTCEKSQEVIRDLTAEVANLRNDNRSTSRRIEEMHVENQRMIQMVVEFMSMMMAQNAPTAPV